MCVGYTMDRLSYPANRNASATAANKYSDVLRLAQIPNASASVQSFEILSVFVHLVYMWSAVSGL